LRKSALRRAAWLLGNAGLVALVCVLDRVTPPHVHLGVLYVLPVLLVTWQDGVQWGLVFAVLTTLLRVRAGLDQVPDASPIERALNEGSYLVVLAVAMSGLAQLRRTQEQLEQLATFDPLTGALNARAFLGHLEYELGRARRYGRPMALLYLDLDNFKTVNDRHGHDTGDAVLRLVGDAIRQTVRRADTVGRLGGDEFAVVMPETDGPVAHAAAARLAAGIRSVFRGTPSVTASIGVLSGTPAGTAEELLRRADQAMYAAKRSGKDRVVEVA